MNLERDDLNCHQAETSIVLAALFEQGYYAELADHVSAADFGSEFYADVWRACWELRSRKREISVLNVMDMIGDEWPDGFMVLTEATKGHRIDSLRLEISKAQLVRDRAKARLLKAAASEIIDIACDTSRDSAEKIDSAQRIMMALTVAESEVELTDMKDTLAAAIEELQRRHESDSEITGLPTGFVDLDRLTGGMQKGEMIVIAGATGSGKSTLATNIVENLSQEGKAALVWSLEMSTTQLGLRHLSSMGGIDMGDLRRGNVTDEVGVKLGMAMEKLHAAKIKTIGPGPGTVSRLRRHARQLKSKGELDIIVVDYLQQMKGENRHEGRTQEVGEISRNLKLLALEMDVPLIAVAQLNRSPAGRTDKRPQLSDLRESGAIEQDADAVWMIYRDDELHPTDYNRNVAEIIVRKNRMGEKKTILLSFFGNLSRFRDFAGNYIPHDEQVREERKEKFSGYKREF